MIKEEKMVAEIERLAYSQGDAARALDVDPRTLRRWVRRGLLKPTIIGGVKRYPRTELIRLIEQGQQGESGGNANE